MVAVSLALDVGEGGGGDAYGGEEAMQEEVGAVRVVDGPQAGR